MSKMSEYLESMVGYDASGLPSSSIQFTFGHMPFQIAETENIADVTTISAVVESDAVVEMKIIGDLIQLSFDFSNETHILSDFVQELEVYKQQKEHVTESLNDLFNQQAIALKNEDEVELERVAIQIRSMSIPFMLPTVMPVCYGGSVHIGFIEDPTFIVYTSDTLNQAPYKITMFFHTHEIFVEDDVQIYTMNEEEEIRAQQEEMWYMQEAKRMEEEEYQAMYGYNAFDYDDNDEPNDKRLKGVRIK